LGKIISKLIYLTTLSLVLELMIFLKNNK